MSFRTAITSVGSYLPGRPITTEDINRKIYETTRYQVTNGLIERLTGVRARYYRAEDEQSSDLAVKAASIAIDRAGVSNEEVDLLIFAACSQDLTEPATANIIQEKMELTNAHVLDVKNACNSFLNALDVADSHVRAGKARCAVVAVGETLSLGIDWNGIRSDKDLRSRIGSLTLGDAGAAVVLTAVPEEKGEGLLTTAFRSYGEKWRLATVLKLVPVNAKSRGVMPRCSWMVRSHASSSPRSFCPLGSSRLNFERFGCVTVWAPMCQPASTSSPISSQLMHGP